MTFVHNLSKITKFASLFGIAPYSLNEKLNKFECTKFSLIYTVTYFLCISSAIIYIAFAYFVNDGKMFQSTFMILTILQQGTVMSIFYATMCDLMLKRKKHANFLNSLVELDSHLAQLYSDETYNNDLSPLHKQHIFVACFNASICIFNSILNMNKMNNFEHVWNALQFFQTIALTFVAYYVRCLATILTHRCLPIFKSLESIGNDVKFTSGGQNHIAKLMRSFESFDEVMDMKKQLSSIFGVQLLLNSAFDFIILTLSVYGLLYFHTKNLSLVYYFTAYNLPHAIKCVLLVLALDTLANQVNELRRCALKISGSPSQELSDLMDLIFLKINHMENDKYVTASDFYPVNRSMLYGMGAAIVTHMLIIFQFQQWEDSQPKVKQFNVSEFI